MITLHRNAYQGPRLADWQYLREPGEVGSWQWSTVPWQSDPYARRVVQAFPDGLTLEQIGWLFGLTRERVRQIEGVALRKLLRWAKQTGRQSQDVRSLLQEAA